MKVLLIAPNSRKDSNICEIPLVTPPINLMYLAEIINRENYHAKILDAYALNMGDLDIINFIKKFEPAVILIPLYSKDLFNVYNLTHKIKMNNPDIIIVLGGHHASNMPNMVLEEFTQVDYILRGEAERTITELLHYINQKSKSLNRVGGLSYCDKKSQKFIHNKLSLIKDLDTIPIPSRDLISTKNYYSKLSKENPLDVIITSRGCPCSCSFCSKLENFNFYRMRSPKNVADEIYEMLNHGAKSIEVYDESFTINKKRCLKIIELIKKEKMDFECRIRTRADFIDAELLKQLKSINCTTISYGVESGNQKILDLNGKGLKLNQIYTAFSLTHKIGINTLGFFLIGFPQDTPQTINETINFAKKLNPKYATFTRIRPFPGTSLYAESKRNNALIGDWSIYQGTPWIKLPWSKSINDIDKYVNIAYHKFYYRPKFVFNFFKNSFENKNFAQVLYALKHSFRNIRNVNPEN